MNKILLGSFLFCCIINGTAVVGLLYAMGISCSLGFNHVKNMVRFCLGAFCLDCFIINDMIGLGLFCEIGISCSSGL